MGDINIEYKCGGSWLPLGKSAPNIHRAVVIAAWHWDNRRRPKVRYSTQGQTPTRVLPPDGWTPHVVRALSEISRKPIPTQQVNNGVSMTLIRKGWATSEDMPSPYDTHKGKSIPHLKITAAGRELLGYIP